MNKPEKNCLNCHHSYFEPNSNRMHCSYYYNWSDRNKICYGNFIPRFPIQIEPHIDETIINPGLE